MSPVLSGPVTIAFRSAWSVVADATHTGPIAVRAGGGDLVVTAHGDTAMRPATTVKALDVNGGPSKAGLSIDKTSEPIAAPISYDGAGDGAVEIVGSNVTWRFDGAKGMATGGLTLSFKNTWSITAKGSGHTLVGPPTDSTWMVTGAGAGTVAGLAFAGIENLTGAADNQDTFVFDTGGSLNGIVDGGAGGLDKLVVQGQHASVASVAQGPNSGTITLDGSVIRYAGLEPITISGVSNVVVTGSASDDIITVHPDPANATTHVEVKSPSTMETVSVQIAGTTSLTVQGAAGRDSITVDGSLALPSVALAI